MIKIRSPFLQIRCRGFPLNSIVLLIEKVKKSLLKDFKKRITNNKIKIIEL